MTLHRAFWLILCAGMALRIIWAGLVPVQPDVGQLGLSSIRPQSG